MYSGDTSLTEVTGQMVYCHYAFIQCDPVYFSIVPGVCVCVFVGVGVGVCVCVCVHWVLWVCSATA